MVESLNVSVGSVRPWHGKFQARFRYSYRDDDGMAVRRQATKMIEAKTLAAAKKQLPDTRQALKQELERKLAVVNVYPEASVELAGYMTRYIDEREASHAIEPTTAANYRACAKQIMRHMPAHIELGKVTAQSVRRMDARLLDDGLCPDTVSKAHRFLKQVLSAAEEEGAIERNPITRDVKPPKRERREADGLDEATRKRLLSIIDDMADTPLSLAVRMGLLTGMRNEEVLGLRWRDVDFDKDATADDSLWGVIHVRRALTTAGGKVVEKGPKSAAGHRDIPLSQELARAMLRRARDAFNAGDTKRIRGLYVLGTPDGRPYNPTVLTREFSSLAKLYNIRCVSGKQATFYALRHTAITTMLRQGVDAKTVSSLAGHSKVAETLDIYAVADADAKRRAVAKVAEAMAS